MAKLIDDGRTIRLSKSMKNRLIKSELKRIKELFANIQEDKRDIVNSMIERLAYMTASAIELEQVMCEMGMVSTYQNGDNQWGTKKAPEFEIYNSLAKHISTYTKQLVELVPEEAKEEVSDGFEEFCVKR